MSREKQIDSGCCENCNSHRDKQIEEIAEIILDVDRSYYGMECDEIQAKAEAAAIYDKDFRKASDVAREIFEEIEKILKKNELRNYEPYNVESYYSGDLEKDLAELKKKYTETEKENEKV